MPLLDIRNLQIAFGQGPAVARVVDGLSLSLEAGQTLCLVGESGSGKSVTALSIARLLASPPARYAGGEILLDGLNVLALKPAALRALRGRIVSYVFQEPGASLNPILRIGRQLRETLQIHRPSEATAAEIQRLLSLVGIPAPASRVHQYPHELSGGMQQRVMIAMALASRPKLLVADEPTTALDVTIQAQIMELLRQLQQQFGMAILLITHNLGLADDFADRVAVMYAGQIVETGPTQELLSRPLHPYTQALLNSVPRLRSAQDRLTSIPGTVPHPGAYPRGCRFHPRCVKAQPSCALEAPALLEVQPGRWVRCPFWSTPTPPTSVSLSTAVAS